MNLKALNPKTLSPKGLGSGVSGLSLLSPKAEALKNPYNPEAPNPGYALKEETYRSLMDSL